MKKLIQNIKKYGLSGLAFLTLARPALAAIEDISLSPGGKFSDLGKMEPARLVSSTITFALVIAALVAFGFLIYGGIIWITSGGDKAKTESARNTITAALVGLLIVFASFAIIKVFETFLGVSFSEGLNIDPIINDGTSETGNTG